MTKYNITQKWVDSGRYEEFWEIELICAVDGYADNMVAQWFLEEVV